MYILSQVTCDDLSFIINIVGKLLKYLHFIIPFALIVLISIDIFKVVVGSADEKAKKELGNSVAKRIIYAIIIFLVPTIVFFIFRKVDEISSSNSNTLDVNWRTCLEEAYNK